jgi:hypothetical protein
MNNLFRRVKSSSLLETIVALTIAAFLFTLVTVVFVQITGKSVSISRMKTHELLNVYVTNAINNNSLINEDSLQDEYLLRKRFEKIDGFPGVVKGEFFVFGSDNILVEKVQRIIPVNENKF